MQLTTVDEIIRRGLLEDNLPIHWYAEFLYHSASCIRELNFDTLQVINTVNLPVNSYGAVDLPDDFSDDLAVCSSIGNVLRPLPKQNWLTPLRIHSTTTGNFVPYSESNEILSNSSFFGLVNGYRYYWNVDAYGANVGRQFGNNAGTLIGYKVIKERRQIQMTDGFEGGSIVLQYISNGQSVNNATQIDYMAFQTIRSYQEWKRSINANNEYCPEARQFFNNKRHLRMRLNPLTRTDITNLFHRAYTAAPKS